LQQANHRKRLLRGIVKSLFRAQRSVTATEEGIGLETMRYVGESSKWSAVVRSGPIRVVGVVRDAQQCPIAGPSSRISSIPPIASHPCIPHIFQKSSNSLATWWTIALDIIVIMREGLTGDWRRIPDLTGGRSQSTYSMPRHKNKDEKEK